MGLIQAAKPIIGAFHLFGAIVWMLYFSFVGTIGRAITRGVDEYTIDPEYNETHHMFLGETMIRPEINREESVAEIRAEADDEFEAELSIWLIDYAVTPIFAEFYRWLFATGEWWLSTLATTGTYGLWPIFWAIAAAPIVPYLIRARRA